MSRAKGIAQVKPEVKERVGARGGSEDGPSQEEGRRELMQEPETT